ncbi:hypothetical protein LOK49_LG07G02714 [Camellia lanceoleosa]|uniref:Uncharacterized protein n=1 Tax=Camellia lanceoleosa TaxID=1840588 RepID=A0ACC0GXE0_9ERIC|nr:hypothetical protein LOK49_LG07G02714 [Camellia lanceoleosa]
MVSSLSSSDWLSIVAFAASSKRLCCRAALPPIGGIVSLLLRSALHYSVRCELEKAVAAEENDDERPAKGGAEKALAKHIAPSDAGEASLMEHVHHDINQESADGSTSIETSSEYVVVGLHSRDDSDIGTKKRQVEEDSSVDSIVIANCSLHEPREEKLEDSTNSENAFLEDYQGASIHNRLMLDGSVL